MSDRVAVTLWEPLSLLLDDGLDGLITSHHAEVGLHKATMPLAVDWDKYHELERLGILKLAAARAGSRLVGYASWMWMPHLHYATTQHALNDAIFVKPDYRGAGVRLIRASERRLAEDAAPNPVRIVFHIKHAIEAKRGTHGRVLERMGYAAFETCWDKMARAE